MQHGPCGDGFMVHSLVSAVLAGINILLVSFLAHRRIVADRERRQNEANRALAHEDDLIVREIVRSELEADQQKEKK